MIEPSDFIVEQYMYLTLYLRTDSLIVMWQLEESSNERNDSEEIERAILKGDLVCILCMIQVPLVNIYSHVKSTTSYIGEEQKYTKENIPRRKIRPDSREKALSSPPQASNISMLTC